MECTWSLENPSDSNSEKYTVESKAFISVVGTGPYYQFDTITFKGGLTSSAVEKKGLVHRYEWDIGNDGRVDTVLYKTDVLKVVATDTGKLTVAIRLIDGAGYFSRNKVSISVISNTLKVPVDTPILIPVDTSSLKTGTDIKILFPDVKIPMDTTCALYAQNEYTIRPVILMGKYFTYKNKTESMELGNFIFELLKNLTGTLDYNTLAIPSKTGFNNGVYTFNNGSLTMRAAFLYGAGIAGHRDNDTVKFDLFDPRSYIKSFSAQLSSPYYKYEQGPLWDLSSGFSVDVSNPLNPRITLNIAIGILKFTGARDVDSRYTMTTEMLDSNQLTVPMFDPIAFRYHGLAKIDPFFVKDIVHIVQNDSLQIDMTGSVIVTDSFPAKFTVHKSVTDSSELKILFMLTQTMLDQKVRFGNGGGNRKVIGSYAAQSQLTLNELSMVKSYFAGAYSTFAADTATFFCDRELSTSFGTLFFEVPRAGYLTFVSDRYSYQVTMKEGVVNQNVK
jgi:hypothetical protein